MGAGTEQEERKSQEPDFRAFVLPPCPSASDVGL